MRFHAAHPSEADLVSSWANTKYPDARCVMVTYLPKEQPPEINILLKTLANKKQSYDMGQIVESEFIFIPMNSINDAQKYGEFISEWFKFDLIVRGEYLKG